LRALEQPTEQCKLIADLVSKGVCFHNAGILQKQRVLIEGDFRAGKIKCITATPTLAMGVNLPTHTVVLPYLHRYGEYGMERISVREVKQQCGRAGRTGLDKEGRAILIAKSEDEKDFLMENYINGQIESVNSKLSIEPLLRMHVLSLIASETIFDLASMENFFSKTFYAFQYGNHEDIFQKVQEIISELQELGFLQGDPKQIKATRIGKRVSELYLDPLSASRIIDAINARKKKNEMYYNFMLAESYEFAPHIAVPKKNEQELWEKLNETTDRLPIDIEQAMYSDNALLRKFNSARILCDWIDEIPEANIVENYSVQPGILRAKLQIVDWLCYSSSELARLLGKENEMIELNKLRKRLKHGIKEELVLLTELRGIGRVRARKLWKANVRSIAALKEIDLKELARILPPVVAVSVKEQLGQQVSKEIKLETKKQKSTEQKKIGEF
jgi:helicase